MLFGLFTGRDINKGVAEFRSTEGAVLLDVRTAAEYNDHHIPGSINIPLDKLDIVEQRIPDKTTPVFVHCLSGGRSSSAAAYLKSRGYSRVKNIGGINSYNPDQDTGNL